VADDLLMRDDFACFGIPQALFDKTGVVILQVEIRVDGSIDLYGGQNTRNCMDRNPLELRHFSNAGKTGCSGQAYHRDKAL
jgi:hypothetical protein